MNPWTILVALLLIGALTGGAYRQGRADGEAKIEAQQARESEIAQKAVDAANATAAAAIAGIKVQHRTITQEVNREVIERPVYRDCLHSPDQLQRINAALTGAAKPEPAGSGVVPRAGAAD
jgi:hypothetical protein